jgi:anti-sigma factor RsiW
MNRRLKNNLEAYLAGDLAGADLAKFEAELERDAAAAKLVAEMSATSALFEAIKIDEDAPVHLDAGFYARVQRSVDEQKQVPFWMVFLEPFMLKRLAFASLMWLFMLGSTAVFIDTTTQRNMELADLILSGHPPTPTFHVRMGADLAMNRGSMLASLMKPGE